LDLSSNNLLKAKSTENLFGEIKNSCMEMSSSCLVGEVASVLISLGARGIQRVLGQRNESLWWETNIFRFVDLAQVDKLSEIEQPFCSCSES